MLTLTIMEVTAMAKNKETSVGNKNFNYEDYKKTDPLSSGLAETHEQVSDTFTEGTIDAKLKNKKGV